MLRSPFKWLVVLLLTNGVLLEINHAYKQAMAIPNWPMPNTKILKVPEGFHHSPFAETPFVRQFDGMTISSGTVMSFDY